VAWSVVQSASGTVAFTSVSATFASNVSAGNKIIVAASIGGTAAPAITSVKDGAGNNWTQLGAASEGNARVYLYALDVPAGDVGTTPTITATWSGSGGGIGLVIQEVSGLLPGNTTAMIDGTAATLTGTTASTGSPSYSTGAASEYLVSVYGDFGTGFTVVVAGGWTGDAHNVNGSMNSNCLIEYKNSTGGSETDGFTTADTGGWAIVEAAFKLAAGSPGQRPQRQKFRKRQVLQRPSPSAAAVSGSVQPWPTVPVPRRRPARALVTAIPVTTTNQPVGTTQPLMTVPIRRRVLQRAVAAHAYGSAYVKVPAPPQGPYLPPRRKPGRAVWRGSAPFPGYVAVPAPPQQPGPAPRRKPGRAVVEFTPVTTANASPAVPVPPSQQPRPSPRRVPGRAVVEFTPVVTTNATAAPPAGTVQPWATVPIRRRVLQRAVAAHVYGAGFVAVPAPRQAPYLPPRRTQARAVIARAYGTAYVAVPAPRQQPGPAPRRKPGRAVVQFRPVRTTNGAPAVTAVLRQGDYDHKSWIKKRWILRV
jgi:hypothetical protein